MAAGEYELAVARLQQHFRARQLALILGPRAQPGSPDERVLLLQLLRGLQEPHEQGTPLPAPVMTWIEQARVPLDLQHALAVTAEAYMVRHDVTALRSLWQEIFRTARLAPTRLHVVAARMAFLGLGQLAALGWDGQLAATCGQIFGRTEDSERCFEVLGSVARAEGLVISASEARRAFGPDGAQAERLRRLFARHHVLLVGAEPTHARLLEVPVGPLGASCLAFRHPRVQVLAWQGLGWTPVSPQPEDPRPAEDVAIGLLEAIFGGMIPDPRKVPRLDEPEVLQPELVEVSPAQVAALGRRISSIAASVRIQPDQLLQDVGLDPGAWAGKEWGVVVVAVYAGASATVGDGGAALAELIAQLIKLVPGNAWLRGVGDALRARRPLGPWLGDTNSAN